MMTVNDLLHAEELAGLTLLTHETNLDAPILQANILENPDAFDWLTPGEILLTTGYIFKDQPCLQKRLIQELANMNCAALGFKVQRYFNEVPQEMIQLANDVGLPILSIPYNYNFSQIISLVNRRVNQPDETISQHSVHMHNKFYTIIKAGGKSTQLLEVLSAAIQAPVMLLDERFQIMNHFDLPDAPTRITSILNNATLKKQFETALKAQNNELLLFYKEPLTVEFSLANHQLSLRILPIKKKNLSLSYLVIWQTTKKLQTIDLLSVEVCAHYLLPQLQLESSENLTTRQKIGALFQDLIQEKNTNPQAWQEFSNYLQLNEKDTFSLLLVAIEQLEQLSNPTIQMNSIGHQLNHILEGYRQKITAFPTQTGFILLLENPAQEEATYLAQTTHLAKNLLEQLMKLNPKLSFKLAIGPTVKKITNLCDSYKLAQETFHLAQASQELQQRTILNYDDLFFYRLMIETLTKQAKQKIYQRLIEPLEKEDQKHESSLLETINTYFQSNKNISLTATNMYVHRNTIIYRLKKIEEILHLTLEFPDSSLQLSLAVYLYKQKLL